MRWLSSAVLAFVATILLSASAHAKVIPPPGGGGGCIATVTTLSSKCGTAVGTIASATDGLTSIDCTTGGGTVPAVCVRTSGGWSSSLGSGTGIGFPGGTGIPQVSAGAAWGSTLPAPSGTIVGTSDIQTLTNKTVDGVSPTTFGFLDATSSIQGQINAKQAALTGTGLARNTGASSEISGDCTTTGSNVITCTKSGGALLTAIFQATLTGTGLARNTGASSELSGVVTTAGNNTTTLTASAHTLQVPWICGDSSGSGTAQVCATSISFTPAAGDTIIYKTTTTNTGDVTLNVNSSSAAHIRKWLGSAVLAAGDLVANTPIPLTYDGTFWEIGTIGNAPSGSGFANPMTTVADSIVGGASGAATRVAGPTTPNGVPQTWTSTPSGGVAQQQAWQLPGVPTNAQTGTTYTVAVTDRASYVSFSNASAIAVTLPQAGSSGFGNNFVTVACDIGAGTATITPTTSTISYSTGNSYTSAASSMALTTGQCAWIYTDNTNYFAILRGAASAGTTTIASGTSAMGTSAISSGTCATVVTTSASGVATTDAIIATPNTDPTAVTGYAPAAGGSLYIQAWPTANNVNFKVCNNTSGSLTPSALTMNWRVVR